MKIHIWCKECCRFHEARRQVAGDIAYWVANCGLVILVEEEAEG